MSNTKAYKRIIIAVSCLSISLLFSCNVYSPVERMKVFVSTYAGLANEGAYTNNLKYLKQFVTDNERKVISVAPSYLGKDVTCKATVLGCGISKDNNGFVVVRIDYSIGAPVIRIYFVKMHGNLVDSFSFVQEYPVDH